MRVLIHPKSTYLIYTIALNGVLLLGTVLTLQNAWAFQPCGPDYPKSCGEEYPAGAKGCYMAYQDQIPFTEKQRKCTLSRQCPRDETKKLASTYYAYNCSNVSGSSKDPIVNSVQNQQLGDNTKPVSGSGNTQQNGNSGNSNSGLPDPIKDSLQNRQLGDNTKSVSGSGSGSAQQTVQNAQDNFTPKKLNDTGQIPSKQNNSAATEDNSNSNSTNTAPVTESNQGTDPRPVDMHQPDPNGTKDGVTDTSTVPRTVVHTGSGEGFGGGGGGGPATGTFPPVVASGVPVVPPGPHASGGPGGGPAGGTNPTTFGLPPADPVGKASARPGFNQKIDALTRAPSNGSNNNLAMTAALMGASGGSNSAMLGMMGAMGTDGPGTVENNCGASLKTDGKACAPTRNMGIAAATSIAALNTAATTAVTAQGNLTQQTLGMGSITSSSGNMQAMLNNTADLQKKSAELQLSTGTIAAAMGAVQLSLSQQHSREAKVYSAAATAKVDREKSAAENFVLNGAGPGLDQNSEGYMSASNAKAAKIIERFDMNGDPNVVFETSDLNRATTGSISDKQAHMNNLDAAKTHEAQVKAGIEKVSRLAEAEQNAIATSALTGGMSNLMAGVGKLVEGSANLSAANRLREASNQLNTSKTSLPTIQLGGTNPEATPTSNAPTQQVITGTTSSAVASPSPSDAAPLAPPPNLGVGNNTDPLNTTVPNSGPGGKFNPSDVSGGGGGGGGVGSGGSTAPASADTSNDPRPQPTADSPKYESAGSGYTGGGGIGNAADRGPDLNSLLEKFLPKKDDPATTNGILEFGTRANTGDQPFSVLDKNANIFERVHETIQGKNKIGQVGT